MLHFAKYLFFFKEAYIFKWIHVIHTAVTMTYSLSKPASVAGRQRWSRQLVLWKVSKIRALILWAAWLNISRLMVSDSGILAQLFWCSYTSSWCVLKYIWVEIVWNVCGYPGYPNRRKTHMKSHCPSHVEKIEAAPCTIGWTDCVDCYPSVWWFSFCEWPGPILSTTRHKSIDRNWDRGEDRKGGSWRWR